MIVSVAQMPAGQSGIVVSISGGRGLVHRMQSLGVRVGVPITKVTGQPLRGPVSIQIGNTELALGFGMARRVMVEVPG